MTGEKGFTLIELLVGMAIGSILLSGLVLGVYQLLSGTARSTNQAVALNDLNNAAMYIKNDLYMAQTTDLNSTPQSSANLSWFDYTSSFGTGFQAYHSAAYVLNGKQLVRTYYFSSSNITTSTVGRNITSVHFTQGSTMINNAIIQYVNVVLTANNSTDPSLAETIRFTVHLRTEGIQ